MSRVLSSSNKSFLMVLALVVALSLFPASWLQGWTSALARMINLPLTPFTHAGNTLVQWSQVTSASSGAPNEADQSLAEQLDISRRDYAAAQLEIKRLTDQLAQLQRIPSQRLQTVIRPVYAPVIGRNPESSVELLELGRGTRDGVTLPAVAVYNGVYLIGRIVEVQRLRCYLQPISFLDNRTTRISAAVLPKDRTDASITDAHQLLLKPNGNGDFIAEADSSFDIGPGDEVFLVDPAWPDAAQAMKLGRVISVKRKDQAPLRDIIIIRPMVQPHEVASVVLLMEGERLAGEEPRP